MSGFYIGVDGKARKVKGAYIGVDGVARKVNKGYIGVDGVASLCWCAADPVFANNTWEQIAAACQSRSIPDTWAVGDQKTMTIGGTDYAIDIIGKDHDDYADGSGKAPLTFQLHDCYGTQYTMNSAAENDTGWSNSAMRAVHLPAILALLPANVRLGIKEVKKYTVAKGTSTSVVETADKLFLLSEVEVFKTTTHSRSGEGEQYDYYAASNSKTKNANGVTVEWWERSPMGGNVNDFCLVSTSGKTSHYNANYNRGVSFAFCF